MPWEYDRWPIQSSDEVLTTGVGSHFIGDDSTVDAGLGYQSHVESSSDSWAIAFAVDVFPDDFSVIVKGLIADGSTSITSHLGLGYGFFLRGTDDVYLYGGSSFQWITEGIVFDVVFFDNENYNFTLYYVNSADTVNPVIVIAEYTANELWDGVSNVEIDADTATALGFASQLVPNTTAWVIAPTVKVEYYGNNLKLKIWSSRYNEAEPGDWLIDIDVTDFVTASTPRSGGRFGLHSYAASLNGTWNMLWDEVTGYIGLTPPGNPYPSFIEPFTGTNGSSINTIRWPIRNVSGGDFATSHEQDFQDAAFVSNPDASWGGGITVLAESSGSNITTEDDGSGGSGGSGVPEGSKAVIGIHGHQGGPSASGGFGSGRDYPVDTTGAVEWTTVTTQGYVSLGSGQYTWDDYSAPPYNAYDWATIEPILDAEAAGYEYVALHGFSAGGAVAALALQNDWQPPDGVLVGVILDDPADIAGTPINPSDVPIYLYGTFNGSTWNANDNNGFDVLAKYESAYGITRIESGDFGGPTDHAPMTRLSGTGPYAPPELLTEAFWTVDLGGGPDANTPRWGLFEVGGLGGYSDRADAGFEPGDAFDITFRVQFPDFLDEGYFRWAWKSNWGGNPMRNYQVSFNNANGNMTVLYEELTGGSITEQDIIAQQTAFITSASDWIYCRVRSVGDNHKVKWWKTTEPSTWNIEFTDSRATGTYGHWYMLGGSATTDVRARLDDIVYSVPGGGTGASTIEIDTNRAKLELEAVANSSIVIVAQDVIPANFNGLVQFEVPTLDPSAEIYLNLTFRGGDSVDDGTGRLTNGYNLWYETHTGYFQLDEINDGVATMMDSYSGWTGGAQDLSVRFNIDGENIRIRMWETGTTEPTSWRMTVTDSTHTGDRFAIGAFSASSAGGTIYIDNVELHYLSGSGPDPGGEDPGGSTDQNNDLPSALEGEGFGTPRTLTYGHPGIAWFWGVDHMANNNELQRYLPEYVDEIEPGHYTLTGVAHSGAPAGYYSGAMSYAYMEQDDDPIAVGDFIQASIKFPVGRGLWGAFWLTNSVGGESHEIDIVEHIGQDTTITHHYVHFSGTSTGFTHATPWTDGNWHTYGVYIAADGVHYYIDGEYVDSHSPPPNLNITWGVMTNLAIGGNWPGSPDSSTTFPAVMEVGSIKVWTVGEDGGGGPAGDNRAVIGLHGAGGGAYLPSGMGSGIGYPQDSHYTSHPCQGNVSWGGGAYSWGYDTATAYNEVVDIIGAAVEEYDQVIIHGFSAGAAAAIALYMHGETFGGKVKGYIFDDPAPYSGGANTPADVPFVLYGCWTGSNWDINNIMGYDLMSIHEDMLNTTPKLSPFNFHRPHVNPNPEELDLDYGWWD